MQAAKTSGNVFFHKRVVVTGIATWVVGGEGGGGSESLRSIIHQQSLCAEFLNLSRVTCPLFYTLDFVFQTKFKAKSQGFS